MLEKYSEIHRIGIHCEAAAVRDVLHYYGMALTIHELLGLAGTLATFCCKPRSYNADMPYLSLSGYTSDMTLDTAVNMGLEARIYNYDTFPKAFGMIKDYIDHDIPVIARMSYETYSKELYDLSPFDPCITNNIEIDFGVHYIQIVGYDDSDQKIRFAESDRMGLQEMSYDLLEKSMSIRTKSMPAENEFFILLPPASELKLDENRIEFALQRMYLKQCRRYNYGNSAFVGELGLEVFQKELQSVIRERSEEYIGANVAWLLISTGGIYKSNYLYKKSLRKFFDTAFRLTKKEAYRRLGGLAGEMDKGWKPFTDDLYQYLLHRDRGILERAVDRLDALAQLERAYSDLLKAAVLT